MTVATEKKIRSYSYTFASDETGLQHEFYSGGTARFADISYAINAGKTLQALHGEEKLGFPFAYSTYIYETQTNTLLVCTRCMRQDIAGRVISCGQVIVYNLKDVLDGEDCMQVLFGTRFLSEEEILSSTNKKHDEIVRRDEGYVPVRLSSLSEARKRTLAAVVCRLMHQKQVVLRLPVGKAYEALGMEVLQQIMALIPQRDRCEISFATACKESDVRNLRRVNLILSNTDEQPDTFADWLDLDAPPELNESELKWLMWCNEEEDIRHDVEYSAFFADEDYTAEVSRRNLPEDCRFLEDFYNDEKYLWWKTDPERRFGSVLDIRKELRDNPKLGVKRFRAEFLQNEKLNALIAEPPDLKVLEREPWVSEETKAFYRENLFKLLITDDVRRGKIGNAFSGAAADAQSRNEVYYDNLCSELLKPFYADPDKGIAASGGTGGRTYAEIIQQIKDRILSYRNI